MIFRRRRPSYTLEELINDLNTSDRYNKAAIYIYGRLQNASKGKYTYLSTEELEDIFQESLMKVIDNIKEGHLNDLKSMEAYFTTIFSRQCVDFIRAQKRLEQHSGKVISLYSTISHQLSDDSFEKILTALEQHNGEEDILRQIEAEFPQCYRLYFLRYFKKLSFEQIADSTSYKSGKVVRSKMSQCKKDIQEKIKW